jgi:hypothetical protein
MVGPARPDLSCTEPQIQDCSGNVKYAAQERLLRRPLREAQKERRQVLGRESVLLASPRSASPKAIRSRASVTARRFREQGRRSLVREISVDNSAVYPHGLASVGVNLGVTGLRYETTKRETPDRSNSGRRPMAHV